VAEKLVEYRENLLCLARGKDWYQHTGVTLERGCESLRHASLFPGRGPAVGFGMIAASAFHDEHIDLPLRETPRLHDCLIVEIDVSRVKNSLAIGAQNYSGRTEYVSCIEELER